MIFLTYEFLMRTPPFAIGNSSNDMTKSRIRFFAGLMRVFQWCSWDILLRDVPKGICNTPHYTRRAWVHWYTGTPWPPHTPHIRHWYTPFNTLYMHDITEILLAIFTWEIMRWPCVQTIKSFEKCNNCRRSQHAQKPGIVFPQNKRNWEPTHRPGVLLVSFITITRCQSFILIGYWNDTIFGETG
jgi:hypothetical protein